MSLIQTYLDPGAIRLNVEAGSAGEVIGLLGEALAASGKVHASYVGAVVARESEMPTGLPMGTINVAIPHTDPVHVVTPALALATLARPVTFRSMDDPDLPLDVRIVFAMALTDKNAQIDMLQTIMGFIQDEAARAALVEAKTGDDVSTIVARYGS